jgi:molecular chaperone DnaK (HSP70)
MQKIQYSTIELVGEASRMPVIQDYIKKVMAPQGMDLSRTMNSQECVAKGCAIASA